MHTFVVSGAYLAFFSKAMLRCSNAIPVQNPCPEWFFSCRLERKQGAARLGSRHDPASLLWRHVGRQCLFPVGEKHGGI